MTKEKSRELLALSQETLEIPLYEPVSNWANAVSDAAATTACPLSLAFH